jgi:hypothetical protein
MQIHASMSGKWNIKSAPDLEDPQLFDAQL